MKAGGYSLQYQWMVSANGGKSWVKPAAASATTATYSFTAKDSQNGYLMKCILKDSWGRTTETEVVSLTVNSSKIQILSQPQDQSVAAGSVATFNVTASGKELSYQWMVSTNQGKSWSIPSAASAKTAEYSVKTKASQNGYIFKCLITDGDGNRKETKVCQLTVR